MFSAREYGQMLMCYGEAGGNATRALRIYRDRYPNQHHPNDARTITAAYQRVLNNEPITPQRQGGGREVGVLVQEQILDLVRRNPQVGRYANCSETAKSPSVYNQACSAVP